MAGIQICCNVKQFKVRWFHSKGAGVVIFWAFLISCSSQIDILISKLMAYSIVSISPLDLLPLQKTMVKNGIEIIWVFSAIFSILLASWLADTKLGNYRVFKSCSVLLYISSVILCALSLYNENTESLDSSNISVNILMLVIYLVNFAVIQFSSISCLVVAVNLGLDQMPDASSDNIISFITWFTSIVTGIWVSASLDQTLYGPSLDKQLLSLVPVVCMSIALCTDFCLCSKWL